MENSFTSLPLWASVLFLLVIPIPVFMLARLAKTGATLSGFTETRSAAVYRNVILAFGLYFLYTMGMTFTGLFTENVLPPKIILFTAIPLAATLFIISGLKPFRQITANVPLEDMVRFHSFRFIGVFFFLAAAYEVLPAHMAWIAGTGDVATALLSFPVAAAIRARKSYARPLTIAWNIFGLLDIISVLTTAILLTRLSIETGSQSVTEIGKFPFSLIPALAPATIIFMHVMIFRKMANKNSPHSQSTLSIKQNQAA